MSKLIKVTQECLDEIRKDFEEALSSGKFSDGKVTFTKTIGAINRKATIYFTEMAWLKMQTLIREFDKEVAWHGIAKRGDDDTKDEYFITDILVYPQEVAAATVTTDLNEYQMWLMNQEDDVFNNIRFQGHSHVNMGTSPSGVDTALYDGILAQLTDEMFYIFMIWNKKGEKTIKLYDMKKNVLFETSDCTVEVLNDHTGIEKWLKDAKAMVKDRAYQSSSYAGSSYRGSSYGGYYGGGSSYYGGGSSYGKTETKSENKSSGKKKGKRKGKKSGAFNNASTSDDDERQLTMLYGGWGEDDDYADPYYAQ